MALSPRNIFNLNMTDNILVRILEILGVNHSRKQVIDKYDQTSNARSFAGISELLMSYGVESSCYSFSNINVQQIPVPFIAVLSGDLFLVESYSTEDVIVFYNGIKEKISINTFYKGWNGHALVITGVERLSTLYRYSKFLQDNILLSLFVGAILITVAIRIAVPVCVIVFIILDIIGLYLSYISILTGKNVAKDKICSMLSTGDCNKVHNSPVSKILDKYHLGEIGISYFLLNIILQIYFNQSLTALMHINILVVVFSVWSILYQKIVLKAWCMICILIQLVVLLKAIGIVITTSDFFNLANVWEYVFIGCSYFIILSVINKLCEVFKDLNYYKEEYRSHIRIKSNVSIFQNLVSQKQYYNTDAASNIIIGKRSSPHKLSIIMNPYCGPCKILHRSMLELFDNGILEHCSIQFIFMAFTDQKGQVIRKLIEIYNNCGEQIFNQALEQWYDKYNLTIFDKYVKGDKEAFLTSEYVLQKEWLTKNNITSSPLILYNGYILPDEYKISDMKFILR